MRKSAQSTFEYILTVTAVIAVVYAFVAFGDLGGRVEGVLDDSIGQVASVSDDIDFPDAPEVEQAPKSTDFLGEPPEGWEPVEMNCGGPSEFIEVEGYDENGLPIFSPPEEYVGNYCAEKDGFDYIAKNGKLSFDHNGTLQVTLRSTDQPVDFDWNNWNHVFEAYSRQRYGDYWTWGCGVGDHSPGFFGAFEHLFGRKATCSEAYDHYYGHTKTLLNGLTGDLAQYNGMTLMDASYKKGMQEHMLVPDDPAFIGTPQEPGEFYDKWDKASWEFFYRKAQQFGLQHKLPFTWEDIQAAFPEEA